MMNAGMKPVGALVSGTSNAVKLLRLETPGRIADSFVADLVIVKGDPEIDISVASDVQKHNADLIFRNEGHRMGHKG